ncbi:MAG: efflux RND transporter periplasmic adaptor subunit [Chloroflexi bacterium]|nr:efflux RND transporter periplasmic adaptor subunit [Chloroflexota bacterium]
MTKRLLALVGLLALASLVAALAATRTMPSPIPTSGRSQAMASQLTASGFIEAEQVTVAPEFAGRIKELTVEEGTVVKAGQVVAVLDDAILLRQIAQAEAAIDVARANLVLVKAGAREEDVRHRKTLVAQAEAVRDGAKTALENARAISNNPQDINSRIVAARGQLDTAERNAALSKQVWDTAVKDYEGSLKEIQAALKASSLQVEQAQIGVDQAERLRGALQPPVVSEDWIKPPFGVQNTLQYDLNVFQKQQALENLALAMANRDTVQTRLDKLLNTRAMIDVSRRQHETAVASRDAAMAVVEDLARLRQNPLALQSQVDSAEAAYQQALAAVEVARAAVQVVLAGATTEQVKVAEAQVRQAESALPPLQTQREKMSIVSPANGSVSQKTARKGEFVLPGNAIVKVMDLETVTLKVFIPETNIGLLKLGSAAQVTVDSFRDRRFPGRVTFISPQAEFTPKDIQTKEERAKTVFAVKITLPNPEGILKPGMPADATIE